MMNPDDAIDIDQLMRMDDENQRSLRVFRMDSDGERIGPPIYLNIGSVVTFWQSSRTPYDDNARISVKATDGEIYLLHINSLPLFLSYFGLRTQWKQLGSL